MSKKFFALLLAVTMLVGLLAGTAVSVSAEDRPDLTFVISSDVGDLSPFGGDSGGRHHTYRMIYDCLAASCGLGATVDELQPQIAKSWTVVDPTTVEIEIFDYVKDSQGNPITASDVVFSYETALASGTMEKLKGYIGSIEATGDYTLTMKMASTAKGAIEWNLTTVPIISEAWYTAASDADKTQNPAGTGAYILVETVADSHTTLKVNEDYWQTDESLRSYYDVQYYGTITMNVARESSMRTIAMESEEADIVQNIPASDIDTFLDDDDYNVFPDCNGRLNVLMFNNDNSVFENQLLRQAALYAIDFEAVRLGYGYTAESGTVCHDFSPDIASDYNEAWNDEDYYGYDVEKAKELMAEAGYPDGGFEVTLMYQNSTTATAGMTVLQDYLAKVGITVNLMPVDQALFNSYKYDDTKWDIIVDSKSTTDFVTNVWLNCFDANSFENGSACFTHDEKLQELLIAASDFETTGEETINAFHEYLKEQAYGIGMFWNYTYYVAQSGIEAMPQDGFGNVTPSTCIPADGFESFGE